MAPLSLACALPQAPNPWWTHGAQERLRSSRPSGAAARADTSLSGGAPRASTYRAEVSGEDPLAQRATGALPGATTGKDSVRADRGSRQLQTHRQTASAAATAAARLKGAPKEMGSEGECRRAYLHTDFLSNLPNTQTRSRLLIGESGPSD